MSHSKQNTNAKIKQKTDSWYIHKTELNKAYFQHDMVYGDVKDLTKRASSDKVLHKKTFTITSNSYCISEDCHQWSKYVKKKAESSALTEDGIALSGSRKFAKEIHKPIIKMFRKCKVHSSYQNNNSK